MKLLFLNTPQGSFTPTHSGAIATIIWELTRLARRNSIDPLIISRSSPHAPYGEVRTIFIDYPPAPANRLALMAARANRKLRGWTHLRQATYARRVASVIRENHLQDHKLVMFNDPEMVVFLRGQFPNLFILHWFQNQLPCKASSRGAYGKSVNITAAVSEFTGRWIEGYYALPAKSARTLYNAVDSERFAPADRAPDGPPVINFVGRTGIEKAPDLLLAAANRLAETTTNFSLQILGANHWGHLEMDDYQRKLTSLSEDLERRGIAVRRPGHIDRASLPAEIRKAHIHVVPSRWDEPFGLVTVEGMASGLATIASATGGTPELIGDAGLLFERDSVEGLAARLAELVESEERRRDVAARCRKQALNFSWEKTWDSLRTLVAA